MADLLACPTAGGELLPRTSSPGELRVTPGGVGRNIAEGMHRCGCSPLFVSAVGSDAFGDQLAAHSAALPPRAADGAPPGAAGGMSFEAVRRVPGMVTATYTAMMDGGGDLVAAVADMDVLAEITAEHIAEFAAALSSAPLIVADANLHPAALVAIASLVARPSAGPASAAPPPLWLEPVSIAKAVAATICLRDAGLVPSVAFASPNEAEALAMAAALGGADGAVAASAAAAAEPDDEAVARAAATLVRAGISHVLVTRGERGVLWARSSGGEVTVESMESLHVEHVVSTRGAGDCFVAGAAALLQRAAVQGADPASSAAVRAAVHAGLRAARLSVLSTEAVPHELCPEAISLADDAA